MDDPPFAAGPKGFLLDFDHSVLALISETSTNPKKVIDKALNEVTGTMPFMAIDVVKVMGVRNSNLRQQVHHDLESFYWVLMYLVILHTSHTRGEHAFSSLFNFSFKEGRKAAAAKRLWLDQAPIEVEGNIPLTTLLRDFTCLVRTQVMNDSPTPSLTHQAILDIMETALESPGWPQNDPAVINPQARANMFAPKDNPDTGYVNLDRFYSPASIQYLVRG